MPPLYFLAYDSHIVLLQFQNRQFVIEVLPRVRKLVLLFAFAALCSTLHAAAQEVRAPIIVSIAGGFVRSDDARHGEVLLAQRLRAEYGDRAHVEVFENRDWKKAHEAILDWVGSRDTSGENVPIILFGHSWGASAVITLARRLEADGIPVLLTIQVDSISKHGANDAVVPANVSEAINFYQPSGVLHGRRQIAAADASRTRILGNLRFKYEEEPTQCRSFPWLNRVLTPGHISIDCDPKVWSQIEELIRSHLSAAPSGS